jgi:hypothetical protein
LSTIKKQLKRDIGKWNCSKNCSLVLHLIIKLICVCLFVFFCYLDINWRQSRIKNSVWKKSATFLKFSIKFR